MFDVDERVEHGVKRARAKLLVEALGERLEIDIGGVHRGEELWSRKLADVARGHRDSLQPDFPAGSRNIDRIFEKDHRIVVGERHRAGARRASGLGDSLRRSLLLQPIQVAGLRDIPVLTELAGEIATGSAEGQNSRAGQEMVQGLLFDWIEAEA